MSIALPNIPRYVSWFLEKENNNKDSTFNLEHYNLIISYYKAWGYNFDKSQKLISNIPTEYYIIK